MTLFQKIANSFAAFVLMPYVVLIASLSFIDLESRSAETVIEFIYAGLGGAALVAIIVRTILWRGTDPAIDARKRYTGIARARYCMAAIMFMYGCAKILGHQMYMSLFWYERTLGQVDGFQLAWTFFSFSKVYLAFIAAVEIIGSGLLVFRRTALLGATVFFGLMVNICLMDFTHDIDAKDIIVILLLVDIYLLSGDVPRFLAFFWTQQALPARDSQAPYTIGGKFHRPLKYAALGFILLFGIGSSAFFGYKQKGTKLEGAWQATKIYKVGDTLTRQYYTDTVSVSFYMEGKGAMLSKGRKQEYLSLTLDSTSGKDFKMVSYRGNGAVKSLKGHYLLVGGDSLVLMARQGSDSIVYMLKRKQ